jgi:uncharacterized protein YqkB
MKDTVETQKQMMKEVNLDNIQDLMDDMHYIKEDQEEMNEAIARTYDVEVNDEELDAGIIPLYVRDFKKFFVKFLILLIL